MKDFLLNLNKGFIRLPGPGNKAMRKAGGHRGESSLKRSSESGVVLVMVLILSAVALAIMTALIYMVLIGTQTSGMNKRYRTALEAGIAGSDVITQIIGMKGDVSSFSSLGAVSTVPASCTGTSLYSTMTYTSLAAKIMTSTSVTGGWSGCDSSLAINPATNTTYDLRFQLGTSPVYNVYSKIVDAVEGNTNAGAINTGGNKLVTAGVVQNSGGEVVVKSIPYLYTIEVDVENATPNSTERAKLQVLYQY